MYVKYVFTTLADQEFSRSSSCFEKQFFHSGIKQNNEPDQQAYIVKRPCQKRLLFAPRHQRRGQERPSKKDLDPVITSKVKHPS